MARKRSQKPKRADGRLDMRMSVDEKRMFQRAAERQGLTLTQWIRLAALLVLRKHDGKVEHAVLDEIG
jgi:uncharacterized protein (DUF1778 family)